MTTPPTKPGFLPWMLPYLAVADVSRSVEFYTRAFGFEHIRTLDGPDGQPAHAHFRYKDVVFMVGTANRSHVGEPHAPVGDTPATLGGTGLVLYCFTDDVDAFYKHAIEAGAVEGFPPDEITWGDRACLVFDPDGHAWNFATNQLQDDERQA
ncbi:MAG: VOC family protein [Myxococcota bacterium]|nr:VOC family protein [Myxococcota bacterium]